MSCIFHNRERGQPVGSSMNGAEAYWMSAQPRGSDKVGEKDGKCKNFQKEKISRERQTNICNIPTSPPQNINEKLLQKDQHCGKTYPR